ncbi:MAG: CinA family protein [Magnetococcales bacterium]|nr:CinA family protein [Magnetococcales bacterium]
MKCLLVMPRWSEHGSLLPPSGRPYLDLTLECLGIGPVSVMEVDADEPFDPADVPDKYKIILVQDHGRGSRLRRSLLSNLGLSLGLGGDESDRLKVLGARTLTDRQGQATGFALERRGRMVAYFSHSVWTARTSLVKMLRNFTGMEGGGGSRRNRETVCWMVEGAGEALELGEHLVSDTFSLCKVRNLPNGDAGLLIPPIMGEEFKNRVRERLGSRIHALAPRPVEEILGERLLKTGLKVTTAESCTAGLIAARLTAVPGSSAYLGQGVVAYANEAKERLLKVDPSLLAACGAVSPEVALAMARGAIQESGADLAVAVTGIAGPDGATPEKPVGTVYLVVRDRHGQTLEHRGFYLGNRERVRWQASQTALHLLRRMVTAQGQEKS